MCHMCTMDFSKQCHAYLVCEHQLTLSASSDIAVKQQHLGLTFTLLELCITCWLERQNGQLVRCLMQCSLHALHNMHGPCRLHGHTENTGLSMLVTHQAQSPGGLTAVQTNTPQMTNDQCICLGGDVHA